MLQSRSNQVAMGVDDTAVLSPQHLTTMEFRCNAEPVGDVEHVEWKQQGEDVRRVAFMAPFEFDWEGQQQNFLELEGDDGDRYVLTRIVEADEGSTGAWVIADCKALGG